MSVLTSLLARDQVVPVKKIEEAIQRQVISGGELPTVLLEVGAAAENLVAAYFAASLDLPPVSRADLMDGDAEATKKLPRALAERHRAVPFALLDGVLRVAVAAPLTSNALTELRGASGCTVELFVSTEPRIAGALQRHYQVMPVPRLRRLLSKLDGLDAGPMPDVASVSSENRVSLPPVRSERAGASGWMRPGGGNAPKSVRPDGTNVRRAIPRSSPPVASPVLASQPKTQASPSTRPPAPSPSTRPPAPAAQAAPAKPAVEPIKPQPVRAVGVVAVGTVKVGGPAATVPRPEVESRYARPAPVAAPASPPSNRAPAPVVVEPPPPPPPSEPLDLDGAVKALADATSRADVVRAAFAYLRSGFDYAAIFTVRDDEAEVIEAYGDGASVDALTGFVVDLQRPGVLHDVREYAAAKACSVDATEADRDLIATLGRGAKQPAVVVPVSIRQRLVLLFYADRGGRSFGLGDVGDVLSFIPRISEALQRIILERKRRGGAALPKASVEAIPTRGKAEDAVGALIARIEKDESEPPPKPAEPEVRPQAFDVLGVPRKAPLPPDLGKPRSTGDGEPTRPDGKHPGKPVADTTYRGGGGEEEVVLTRRKRSSRPAPAGMDVPGISVPPAAGVPRADRVSDPPPPLRAAGEEPPRPMPAAAVALPEIAATPTPKRPAVALPAEPDPKGFDEGDDDDDEPSIEVAEAVEPSDHGDATIITDMGLDLDDLVDNLLATDRAGVPAVAEHLASFGDPALRVLMKRFPGPTYERAMPSPEGPHPRAREAGPLLTAVVAIGKPALPALVALFEHKEAAVRYYAVLCAAELPSRELVARMGRRVIDEDPAVRAVAAQALAGLRKYESEMADVLTHLRRVGGNDRAPGSVRRLAIELLGELRDGDAVKMLVHVLGSEDTAIAAAARRAMTSIAKVDHGMDAKAWAAWLAAHGSGHRIEWLIDALLSEDEALRREAGDELKSATREFFGFQAGLPRKDREVVQRKYRKWWDQIGRSRFVTDRD